MPERIGRFQRITADEAHQRLTSSAKDNALKEELTQLFATMAPLEHYELVLQGREKGVVLRERIMRFAQDSAIDGVHVRAGRKRGKKTIIVWREARPGQTSSADIPPEAAAQVTPVAEVVPDAVLGEGEGIQPPYEKS
jgi:hypothetical protein